MSNVKIMATSMLPKTARVSRATLGYSGRQGGKALTQRMYHSNTLYIQQSDNIAYHQHARGVVCMAEPDEEQLRAANAEYAQLSDAIEVRDIITVIVFVKHRILHRDTDTTMIDCREQQQRLWRTCKEQVCSWLV